MSQLMLDVHLPGDEPPAPKSRRNPARLAARAGMSAVAERMNPTWGPQLRHVDPVAYWDARQDMDTYRALLCLAIGVPVEHISRDGYKTRGGGS